MQILGIETSCDDTAAAVVRNGRILSNVVSSQDAVHGPYGGVVPELASRHHIVNILPVIHQALNMAGKSLDEIEGIAVTHGPGLVGSLLVGLAVAKGLALGRGLPWVGVNHLEGHLLAVLLEEEVPFPFLGLLVSGGHTCLYRVQGLGQYLFLGGTRDDAAGEAFDKAAKMMGLGYPGGRVIDQLATGGDPTAIRFPRAHFKTGRYDFSFSGLKTALRQFLLHREGSERVEDLAASFQEAVVDMLVVPTLLAAHDLRMHHVVVAGGVSANSRLRQRMREEGSKADLNVSFPSLKLCTDNAAMIAFAGAHRLAHGERGNFGLTAYARLPLGEKWENGK